jgi:predicted RNA-binding Zn ribbon-like protein
MLNEPLEIMAGPAILNLETGQLCLDFANTANWHASEHPEEELNSYSDLTAWAQRIGLAGDVEAAQLLEAAARRPAEAAAVLARAVALREAIYHIFSTRAQGLQPEVNDLSMLNAALDEALSHLRLAPGTAHFDWQWIDQEGQLDGLLWPVALSAARLLASDGLERVGECADDRGCGYLFFDTSRNHSRRWCEMRDCGNRAKARRHYRRIKDG